MWYFLASDGYSVYYVLTIYGIPGMWHVFSMCYLSDLAGTVNSKTSVRFIQIHLVYEYQHNYISTRADGMVIHVVAGRFVWAKTNQPVAFFERILCYIGII